MTQRCLGRHMIHRVLLTLERDEHPAGDGAPERLQGPAVHSADRRMVVLEPFHEIGWQSRPLHEKHRCLSPQTASRTPTLSRANSNVQRQEERILLLHRHQVGDEIRESCGCQHPLGQLLHPGCLRAAVRPAGMTEVPSRYLTTLQAGHTERVGRPDPSHPSLPDHPCLTSTPLRQRR